MSNNKSKIKSTEKINCPYCGGKRTINRRIENSYAVCISLDGKKVYEVIGDPNVFFKDSNFDIKKLLKYIEKKYYERKVNG